MKGGLVERIVLFLVSFLASSLGSAVGVGGGIIIKPVLDALSIFPAETISFLSGTTVCAMSGFSLFCMRKEENCAKKKTTIFLAAGAVLGGIAGKRIMDLALCWFSGWGPGNSDNMLVLPQSCLQLAVNTAVFLYIRKKSQIQSVNIKSLMVCLGLGLGKGLISSFLGIGGGAYNVAVLYYFFSMNSREAGRNSLYIIFCSQLASAAGFIFCKNIPEYPPAVLGLLIAGALSGGYLGSKAAGRLSHKKLEQVFSGFMVLIILLNLYNMIHFSFSV